MSVRDSASPTPPGVTIETGPVLCSGCARPLEGLVFEVVLDITQLRCGAVLIQKLDANCIHCGRAFHWSLRDKDLREIAFTFGELKRKYLAE